MVFNDGDARRRLNSVTHLPIALELVRQLAVEWLSLTSVVVSDSGNLSFVSTQGTVKHTVEFTLQVVDMPLLVETGSYRLMWPRVFVTCSHETEASAATAEARAGFNDSLYGSYIQAICSVFVTCALSQMM